jgi:hypothetical protein
VPGVIEVEYVKGVTKSKKTDKRFYKLARAAALPAYGPNKLSFRSELIKPVIRVVLYHQVSVIQYMYFADVGEIGFICRAVDAKQLLCLQSGLAGQVIGLCAKVTAPAASPQQKNPSNKYPCKLFAGMSVFEVN